MNIRETLESINLAEKLSSDELKKIGAEVIEGFEADLESRQEWMDRSEEWMKLATQVKEEKSFPWPNAANVKYPILTTAAMQFAARAYPALLPNTKLVNGLVTGADPQGILAQSAQRIGKHMSYQLLYEMPNWEEDMDKLCLILPILGCCFKKTYYDPVRKQNISELVLPKDLVINYYAKSMEDAFRKSHIIELDENKVYERKARGVFLDEDFGEPTDSDLTNRAKTDSDRGITGGLLDDSTPHTFIECHTYWDLDDDGYKEPYTITVHYESKKVARITPRFTKKDLESEGKKVISIKPTEHFTKFDFIPNPDGSIYSLGFGLLLGGINDTVNTLTNQLLDAGTLANLQAGFLGRGIRMRGGNTRFQPGEWKPVDFTGEDIKKHIFPLPSKDPSSVLFQLLQALITGGKELASVAEIFTGKMPGQNTPATTTMATIEQGLKVFTAIYKRIYRSLGKEYEKLFRLNATYMEGTTYFTLNAIEGQESSVVYTQDYSNNITVKPSADPNIASEAQKLAKAQGLLELIQLGTINPQEVTKRVLEAQDQIGIDQLMKMPPPQPNPDQMKMQADMQMEQQKFQHDAQLKERDAAIKEGQAKMAAIIKEHELQLKQQEAMMNQKMDAMAAALDMRIKETEHQMEMKKQYDQHQADMAKLLGKAHGEKIASDMKIQQLADQHAQKMQHSKEEHKQKMTIKKTQDGYEVQKG